MTTMMLTAINKCNWLQLEIVGRHFMVECKPDLILVTFVVFFTALSTF